jgi:hypothetical protein
MTQQHEYINIETVGDPVDGEHCMDRFCNNEIACLYGRQVRAERSGKA